MESILRLWDALSSAVWGPVMLGLLLGTGVYLTVRCRFFQFTHFFAMLRKTLGGALGRGGKRRGGISPFAAVSTALAGTMGTGNITGVAAAMLVGGPGAVFWMWVSALFGMMTKYAEVVLAVRFRANEADGSHWGGPMLYLRRGLRAPILAALFCAFCVAASFGIGNMAQSNAVAGALRESFGVPEHITGLFCAGVVALVVVGGLRRIASVTQVLVPLMSALYLAFALVVLLRFRQNLPQAFADIFAGAFTPLSVAGGCGGWGIARAMRCGISRGVFSNEAGLGSAPIAHAAAEVESPEVQGMWGMFEVFADTLVCCTITALVLLVTGVTALPMPAGGMTSAAFSMGCGAAGGAAVSVSLVFFAFSSILGWCYYGESCLRWLTRGSGAALAVYRCLFLLLIPVGAVTRLEAVWSISDTLNGLMAVPNLVGILGLSGVVAATTRKEKTPLARRAALW